MDLIEHLRAFVAVAEQGTFTAAAAVCRCPQPVISRRIATLEREVGNPLFERNSRSVTLTSTGSALVPHAQDLVARADRFAELGRTQALQQVAFGVPLSVCPGPLAVATGLGRDAGLSIHFRDLSAQRLNTDLADGRLAAAVVSSPVDRASVTTELGVASATGRRGARFRLGSIRPLRGRRRPVRLWLTDDDDVPPVRDVLLRAAAEEGLRTDQVQVAPSTLMALVAVHGGTDLLLCHRELAEAEGLSWQPAGILRGSRVELSATAPGAATVRRLLPRLLEQLAAAVHGEVVDGFGTTRERNAG